MPFEKKSLEDRAVVGPLGEESRRCEGDRGFRVAGLGEIAIRCDDRPAMERFYRDVIGLEPFARREGGVTFFRVAEGHEGHTTVLALFERGEPAASRRSGNGNALHHIALTLGWDEQAAAMAWFDRMGQPYRIELFDWAGWRGLFLTDPEQNVVELVSAYPRDAR